jgi:hypothetical protein
MPLLSRATESQQSEWKNVAEGLWRWHLAKPEIKEDKTFGGYRAHFLLKLTPDEQKRLLEEAGEPDDGVKQSYQVTYRTGLSLGWIKDGQYQATKFIDFLCAVLGTENGKKFRKWIEAGNGPPRPADKDDQQAELEMIQEWLGWWEDLEVYGTITHSTSKDGRVWANFGGPMPIGSLPKQPEPDYQALCRGKLRAMISEIDAANEAINGTPVAAPASITKRSYEEVFPEDKPVAVAAAAPAADDDDLPF